MPSSPLYGRGGGAFSPRLFYHSASRSSAIRPKLSSLTDTARPQSGQRIDPFSVRAAKIMSSNVSPSPRQKLGPSSVMRSKTSVAEASGGATNRQQQFAQYSLTCMAHLGGSRGEETLVRPSKASAIPKPPPRPPGRRDSIRTGGADRTSGGLFDWRGWASR